MPSASPGINQQSRTRVNTPRPIPRNQRQRGELPHQVRDQAATRTRLMPQRPRVLSRTRVWRPKAMEKVEEQGLGRVQRRQAVRAAAFNKMWVRRYRDLRICRLRHMMLLRVAHRLWILIINRFLKEIIYLLHCSICPSSIRHSWVVERSVVALLKCLKTIFFQIHTSPLETSYLSLQPQAIQSRTLYLLKPLLVWMLWLGQIVPQIWWKVMSILFSHSSLTLCSPREWNLRKRVRLRRPNWTRSWIREHAFRLTLRQASTSSSIVRSQLLIWGRLNSMAKATGKTRIVSSIS